jgi:hypothetical protein
MARRVDENERREAVTIIEGTGGAPPDDVDDSFDQWRESLHDGQVPGKVTAYQIPMDDHGVPQPSARNQVRLGAWPSDAYDFDGLCALLIRDFMPFDKILCVRLLGTKAGTAGLQFNKVITLRAPNTPPKENGAAPESTASLMRIIQENNERMLAQFKAMMPVVPQRDATEEMQRMMVFAQTLNGPQNELLKLLLPALAGRPAPAASADPFSQLSGLVDVFEKLQDLRGGGGGDGGTSGNDLVDVIKAIAPLAGPALQAIPSIIEERRRLAPVATVPPQNTVAQRPPVGPRPPPPGSVPTQPTVVMGGQNAPAQPAGSTLSDLSTEDQQMFAQLKPQIDALVQMAAQGSDPTGAADILFEQIILPLPDEFYDRLYTLISGANFITQAAVFNPAVNSHAEWFKQFQKRICERYDAEEAAARDAPTPA